MSIGKQAGAQGEVIGSLGVFQNDPKKTRSEYFCLRVSKLLDDWKEGRSGRVRRWFPCSEAESVVSHDRVQLEVFRVALDLAVKSSAIS